MPTQRYGVGYGVTKEAMCAMAPVAVEEMMRRFVREVSPDWSTVRMEITDGPFGNWSIRLSGEGVERG